MLWDRAANKCRSLDNDRPNLTSCLMKLFDDLTCDRWNYSLIYSIDLLRPEKMADKNYEMSDQFLFRLDTRLYKQNNYLQPCYEILNINSIDFSAGNHF